MERPRVKAELRRAKGEQREVQQRRSVGRVMEKENSSRHLTHTCGLVSVRVCVCGNGISSHVPKAILFTEEEALHNTLR